MTYNIRELEEYFVSLGGRIVDGEYKLPLIENVKIRRLESKITTTLLEYKHALDKNTLRAQIPSYRRKLKEARDLEVKRLEGEIEADKDRHPGYIESKVVKRLLDAVRAAKSDKLIGDTFSRETLTDALRANGGKATRLTGKRRTRVYVYEPPVIESESITQLNDVMVADMAEYTSNKHKLLSRIPAIRRARDSKLLTNIEKLDKAILDEKMQTPEYADSTKLIAILQAIDSMEKESNFGMGKETE